MGQERLDKVRKKEKELLENLEAQKEVIIQDMQTDQVLTAPGHGVSQGMNISDDVAYDLTKTAEKVVEQNRSLSFTNYYGPIPGADSRVKTKEAETRDERRKHPTNLQLPTPPHFSLSIDESTQELGEVKPDVSSLVAEMSAAFKAQSQIIRDLTSSHLQLQQEMKEMLKIWNPLYEVFTYPKDA